MNRLRINTSPLLLCGLLFLFTLFSSGYAAPDNALYLPEETCTQRAILRGLEKQDDLIALDIIKVKEAQKSWWEVYAAYPETSLNYSPRISFTCYDTTDKYCIGIKPTLLTKENTKYEELEEATAEIISKLKDKPDREKVDGVKYWIDMNCSYTKQVTNMWDESLYGCLVKGEATCLGYAEAFYYMMRELQVPCRIETNEFHA